MKAALLRGQPGMLDIADVTVAHPLQHEVLVRTVACGICHSDLNFVEDRMPVALPCILGHEAAGIVEAVGASVTEVAVGDHVVACLSGFCGHCDHCLTGRSYRCRNRRVRKVRGASSSEFERPAGSPPAVCENGSAVERLGGLGGFAENMLVHERFVVAISKEMPLDRAALLGCGVTTGVGAALNTARVRPGSSVAVIGCGGVGLNCIQGARLAGASKIIAIDIQPAKLELAKQFGATDTVDAAAGDPVERVFDLTGRGVDYAFEALGSPSTAQQALGMLDDTGTATLIGMGPSGSVLEVGLQEFVARGIRVQGSPMGSNRFRLDIPTYVDYYLQGRLHLDELISSRVSLEDVNEGLRALQEGRVARSVVVFDD